MSKNLYEYPLTNNLTWWNDKSKTAEAPFFFLYRKLFGIGEVTLTALLREYANKYGCSSEEAKKIFYLEQGNYHFKKKKEQVYVSCSYATRTGRYAEYSVLKPEYLNDFCVAETRMGLRCRQHSPNRGYCTQHTKSLKDENNLVSSEKLERNVIPESLIKEKDIEKLRDVCITVYLEYHHQWATIINLSQKRNKNRNTLFKINKLQLEINKLKEELE